MAITHTRAATDRWSDIVDDVNTYGKVLVTDDEDSKVVVMSFDEFSKMEKRVMDLALEKVRAEIDAQVAVMNAPDADEKMRAFMDSTPQEFADAANAAEQRRRN